ncbi:MAG: hypothetical protein JRJ09_18180 [Deltaproteobacteria bacterium]|nr:hypothetical protein [Deltaproteobacteria bacterium]
MQVESMDNLMKRCVTLPRRIASYFLRRQMLARLLITLLRLRFRKGQIPLHQVARLRTMFRGSNVFEPHPSVYVGSGLLLNNRALSRRLAYMETGMWTLGVDTLNYLERLIQALRPEAVLEFGSGLSTLCLCQYMFDLHGDTGSPRVFSIDQESRYLTGSRVRLAECGFENLARLAHRPLIPQCIEGVETECYDLPHDFLSGFLGGSMPGLLIVDGPAGEDGVRFGTLPLVKDFVPTGARFVLDDALRDSELKTSLMWDRLPYLRVFGIKPVSKGLLLGEVFHK